MGTVVSLTPQQFQLFIAVPMTLLSIIPITIVAAIATFAAVEEGHFIRTKRYK